MIREAEPNGNNCENCYHVDRYTNPDGKLYLLCSLLRCGFMDAPIIKKPEHTICDLWRRCNEVSQEANRH